jgi:plasmid stabilization system protein ParE
VKIVLLVEAQQRLEIEDDWWRTNRDAKDLFVQEFAEVLELLQTTPKLGQHYTRVRGRAVLRVLMKKTRCHVYYHLNESEQAVEIYSVWGARKGQGPKL